MAADLLAIDGIVRWPFGHIMPLEWMRVCVRHRPNFTQWNTLLCHAVKVGVGQFYYVPPADIGTNDFTTIATKRILSFCWCVCVGVRMCCILQQLLYLLVGSSLFFTLFAFELLLIRLKLNNSLFLYPVSKCGISQLICG